MFMCHSFGVVTSIHVLDDGDELRASASNLDSVDVRIFSKNYISYQFLVFIFYHTISPENYRVSGAQYIHKCMHELRTAINVGIAASVSTP